MAKLSTTSVFGDLLVDGMIHGNVTGNLTGNASTATSATTATSAGKWTTARTITIGSKGKTVDGSGNVSWTLAEIGAAASDHKHGLLHDNLTCTLENTTTDNGWSMINSSYNGFLLKSIRTNSTAPNWICNNYSAGIAFGGSDTKGVISTAYSSPSIKFAGGNGTKPVWWIGLTGTAGTSYNLANFENKNHGTHVTYSTSAPLVAGTASAGSAANVARGDHVHPAQTSVSGNAGTATKLQTARTITIGNKSNTFDGSANITYTLADIGAATSGHTHNYAGSSSAGGAANSAVKLSSARTINGTSFDGSANITTANWGTARKINQISVNGSADIKLPLDYYTCNIGNSNAKPYHHILTTGQCTGSYTDKSITIVLVNHYNSAGLGIAKATLRTNDAANGATASGELRWLVRSGFAENQLCFNIRNTAKDTYMDVFYKSTGTYNSLTWYVLTEGARGSHGSQWTKYNTHHDNGTNVYDETGMKAIRTYTATLQSATDNGAVNSAKTAAACSGNAATATKLATARTLTIGNTGKSFDGSANVSWSLSEIGALPTAGGDVTGNIKVTNDSYLEWNRNTDYARISFKNTGDSDSDSYMYFLAGDNGNEYFKFSSLSGSTTTDLLTIKTDHLRFKGNNVYHAGNKPTLSELGAAAASHGTHVTYSTTTPLVAGTASVGSANNVSRGDHVHPPQTSVSGNAGTATKLATARTIQIGNKSNSFDGSANITYTLADIGAAATSHTHNQINSRGNVTCESGVAGRPAVSGLSMSQAYNNGYPTTYGNVISLKGTGDGQILVGWSGTDGAHAPVYVRSKRDNTSTANWSDWAQFYTTANKPTYSDVGAAAASHGTHVTYATATPLVAGTASVGSANNVARGDHVHPLQTSVSGNAGTATKLQTARNINGTSFDGSANITTANWGTSRTITIGKTGKSVNGSGNVSWTMNEIMGAVSLSSSGTANKNKYIKFATVTLTNTWQCCSGKLALTNTEAIASYGILHFYLRNGSAITTTSIELGWLTLNNSNYANRVYAVKVSDGKYDLYYRPYSDYETTRFTLLECNDPGLITLSAGSYTDSITAAHTSSIKGVAASALKLTTARNIKIGNKSNSFDGSGNIEFTLADIGIGSSISAVASNLSGVTINGYDSMMTTINSNLGNL